MGLEVLLFSVEIQTEPPVMIFAILPQKVPVVPPQKLKDLEPVLDQR